MARPTLDGIGYSPWTERARWALDHHRIDYRFREHVPMLGEALLRFRAKPPPGTRATVPFFRDDTGAYRDSIDIIVHADRVGKGSKLVRDEAALREIAEIAEPGLRAVRARVTSAVLADPQALRESAQAAVPAFLGWLFAPVAAQGARFIGKKYGATLGEPETNAETTRQVLAELRKRIDTSSVPTPETLRAEHLVLATLVQGFAPVQAAHIPLLPAVRRAWTWEPLAREAADVVRWRDALYASARAR